MWIAADSERWQPGICSAVRVALSKYASAPRASTRDGELLVLPAQRPASPEIAESPRLTTQGVPTPGPSAAAGAATAISEATVSATTPTPTATRRNPPSALILAPLRQNGTSPVTGEYDRTDPSEQDALAAGSAQRAGDEAVDQLGVLDAGRRPGAGKHRDRREAGHGVHLVHEHRAVRADEKVDAGEAGTVQGGERPAGKVAHLRRDVGGQPGRDVELAGVVDVLRVKVVPVVAAHQADLGQHAGDRPAGVVLDDTALDLAPDHGRLDENLVVVRERRLDGCGKVGPALHLGDADTRSRAGRLDEHRQAQVLQVDGRHVVATAYHG